MSFIKAQMEIAHKQGISMKKAGAILAYSSRHASPEAKRKNKKLNKVRG